jgi:SAM-dependent methyltransferase
MNTRLEETFGNIDIYLFDQLMKGRFENCKTVLDAGCGTGRNVHYFLKNGYKVFGVDESPVAINEIQQLALGLAPQLSANNFIVAQVEKLPFEDLNFDVVISSAVLHFAKDQDHFDSMVREMWRVLKRGGFLFCRLASNIGIEALVKDRGEGRYLLPDGSTRYLADQQLLLDYTLKLNGQLFEPIKTTNVQNLRCMTTWCLQKI